MQFFRQPFPTIRLFTFKNFLLELQKKGVADVLSG